MSSFRSFFTPAKLEKRPYVGKKSFHVGTYPFQLGKNMSLLTLFFCQEENAFSVRAPHSSILRQNFNREQQ
jgi:hypothetical protein